VEYAIDDISEVGSMNDIEKDILKYIRGNLAKGNQFYKSKHIAQELALSSKTVGVTLGRMQNKIYRGLKIIPYSSTTGTTWKAERVRGS
jgi:Mn-dependent DtxR family transcriptional regulator